MHDITVETLVAYFNTLRQNGEPIKPSTEQAQTIALLSKEVQQWQERIRIHRGKPRVWNRKTRDSSKTAAPEVQTPEASAPEVSPGSD